MGSLVEVTFRLLNPWTNGSELAGVYGSMGVLHILHGFEGSPLGAHVLAHKPMEGLGGGTRSSVIGSSRSALFFHGCIG